MIDPYLRRARLIRVHDVATLEVQLALGWSVTLETMLSLADVRPDPDRELAMYVVDWCRVASETTSNRWPLVVASIDIDGGVTVGRLYRNDGHSLCDDLLERYPLLEAS